MFLCVNFKIRAQLCGAYNMNLSYMDKASDMTPRLLSLRDKYISYRRQKGADKNGLERIALINAITEVLELDASPRDTELVADVIIELLRQAEYDLKKALAEKLSAKGNIPLRVILHFTNEDISIAGSILENSPVLDDLDLVYIVKSKTTKYWSSIAARKALSEHLMNTLADTKDLDTAITLAQNLNITLTGHTITALTDVAQTSERLALPLLRRDEVDKVVAARLYNYVGYQIKAYIESRFGLDPNTSFDILNSLEEVVVEFVDSSTKRSYEVEEGMLEQAKRQLQAGNLTLKNMVTGLRRGQIASFSAQFSVFTGLDLQTTEEILRQKHGQGLAVACKAFDIKKEDFVSIYLLTSPLRDEDQEGVSDMKDMTRAMSYFKKIKKDVAHKILNNSISS